MSSQKRGSPDSDSSSSSDESSEMNNNQPQAKKLKVDEFSASVSGVVQDMDDQKVHLSSEEEDSDLEYEHNDDIVEVGLMSSINLSPDLGQNLLKLNSRKLKACCQSGRMVN